VSLIQNISPDGLRKQLKLSLIALTILTMSGCATTEISTDPPCLDKPVLDDVSLEKQLLMDSFALMMLLETKAGCEA